MPEKTNSPQQPDSAIPPDIRNANLQLPSRTSIRKSLTLEW